MRQGQEDLEGRAGRLAGRCRLAGRQQVALRGRGTQHTPLLLSPRAGRRGLAANGPAAHALRSGPTGGRKDLCARAGVSSRFPESELCTPGALRGAWPCCAPRGCAGQELTSRRAAGPALNPGSFPLPEPPAPAQVTEGCGRRDRPEEGEWGVVCYWGCEELTPDKARKFGAGADTQPGHSPDRDQLRVVRSLQRPLRDKLGVGAHPSPPLALPPTPLL